MAPRPPFLAPSPRSPAEGLEAWQDPTFHVPVHEGQRACLGKEAGQASSSASQRRAPSPALSPWAARLGSPPPCWHKRKGKGHAADTQAFLQPHRGGNPTKPGG